MAFFNESKGKQEALLKAFSGCDKRWKYHLYLASCYFTCDAAKELIKAVKQQFKIIDTEIWLDQKTAIAIGPEQLTEFAQKQNIKILIAKSTKLFHTKGYCLVRFDDDNKVEEGCLVIGSANLTGAGLTCANGNIESLLASYHIEDIQSFYDSQNNGKWIEPEDCELFTKEDDNFIFALLNEGQFCHKWSDSLSQYLAVRYDLSEEGKKRSQGDPLFQETGFVIAAATISKQYFDYKITHPVDPNLIRNYGIETFLGHWLPDSVLQNMAEDGEFQQFRKELFTALNDQMSVICDDINRDYQRLKLGGFVDSEKDPTERFREKIDELKENDDKLYRIWCQREFFTLPYDISNRERIRDTYESILETLEKNQRWNRSMKAVKEAREQLSLEPLRELQPE